MSGTGHESHVDLQPARTGRPRLRAQSLKPNERVLVSARLPAELAARVYAAAHQTQQPVSGLVEGLLAKALEDVEAPLM